MPELPEVETSKRGIAPHIEGASIEKFVIRNASLRWPVPEKALNKLRGETITAVKRRGKYICIESASGYQLLHLGMSGSLRVLENKVPPGKHDHVDLCLDNGKTLRLNDPRRFGCWLFQAGEDIHELLLSLGPEPLSDDFDGEYLHERSRGKTQAVKTFIMDSKQVVGVGNIYAAESLFRAGIHPKRAAGKISKQRYDALSDAIKEVLAEAIHQGGTSLKDFTATDGKPGYFKQELQVYDRENLPCKVCKQPIKNIKLGQRSTFYCGSCQK